jgi:hypothetical protein
MSDGSPASAGNLQATLHLQVESQAFAIAAVGHDIGTMLHCGWQPIDTDSMPSVGARGEILMPRHGIVCNYGNFSVVAIARRVGSEA